MKVVANELMDTVIGVGNPTRQLLNIELVIHETEWLRLLVTWLLFRTFEFDRPRIDSRGCPRLESFKRKSQPLKSAANSRRRPLARRSAIA